jgi:hypothetical protein
MRIRCRGNVFTEPMARNDSDIFSSQSLLSNGSTLYIMFGRGEGSCEYTQVAGRWANSVT